MAVEIICEASKNWLTKENISIPEALKNAKKLAWVAKEAGGDCVKYQCHVAQDENPKRHPKRHSWIRLNEVLTPFDTFWKPLKEYCDEIGIEFMCTPMSKYAFCKIESLVKTIKIASPDLRDLGMLNLIGIHHDKKYIFSTGMTDVGVLRKALDSINYAYLANGKTLPEKPRILHCVSEYPLPIERASLGELIYFDGLSDHTLSLITGAMAVARGATIIEKHFTFNNWGKDANVSLNPDQLKIYIENIREAEKAMRPVQRPTEKERELLKDFWYETTLPRDL